MDEELNTSDSSSYLFYATNDPSDTQYEEDDFLDPFAAKKRGKNKVYVEFKRYDKEFDLNTVTEDLKQYGWIKGDFKKLYYYFC